MTHHPDHNSIEVDHFKDEEQLIAQKHIAVNVLHPCFKTVKFMFVHVETSSTTAFMAIISMPRSFPWDAPGET